MATSVFHDQALTEAAAKLRLEGYRVIVLSRKVPDALALKGGQVFAIEVLGQRWTRNHGWVNPYSKKEKEAAYAMFDGVLFHRFRYPRHEILQPENAYYNYRKSEAYEPLKR